MQQQAINELEDLDALFSIKKHTLKQFLTNQFRKRDIDLLKHFDAKLLNQATVYLQGYSHALREHVTMPINKIEMQNFLQERVFEYIREEIIRHKDNHLH
jgi:hypothetical protein